MTCEKEIADGGNGKCEHLEAGKRGLQGKEGRRKHLRTKAHKGDCGREEWSVRVIVEGLRGLHERGEYVG
jgi:hypothetical protein